MQKNGPSPLTSRYGSKLACNVCTFAHMCLCGYVSAQYVCVISGAVDGGEAESSRQSVRRLRGAFVSAVPGAAGLGAGEGGRHRPAGAAAGGAGKIQTHEECHQSTRWIGWIACLPGAKECRGRFAISIHKHKDAYNLKNSLMSAHLPAVMQWECGQS